MELTRLICVLALAGVVSACGSDITNTGDGTGGGPIGNDGGDIMNACLNEADTAVFDSLTYDDEGTEVTGSEAASAIGSDCVLAGCFTEVETVLGANTEENRNALAACIEGCTQEGIGANTDPTGGMLSEDCISCYGGAASCGAAFCALECIADVTAPVCIQCRDDNGCNGNFDTCSGFFD